MKRFLSWLNAKLNIVETDDEANAYYSWADHRLDQLAAEARQHDALKRNLALRGYRLVDPEEADRA